jgi:hypothetical protein
VAERRRALFRQLLIRERRAQWIDDHTWLTVPANKNTGAPRNEADQPSSTDNDEQQNGSA